MLRGSIARGITTSAANSAGVSSSPLLAMASLASCASSSASSCRSFQAHERCDQNPFASSSSFSSCCSRVCLASLLSRSSFSFANASSCCSPLSAKRHFRSGGSSARELELPPPPPPSSPIGAAGTTAFSSSSPCSSSVSSVSLPQPFSSASSALSAAAIPAAPPASSAVVQSTMNILQALEPPRDDNAPLRDIASARCPFCSTQLHIKELLQHIHNFHPTCSADLPLLRKLLRGRYSLLHTAIKRLWSLTAPKGSLANKLKGGFPCRHCKEDETGLRPLFPTVDELMKHLEEAHEKDVDIDAEEPPARMTVEEVQVVIDRLRNGDPASVSGSNNSSSTVGFGESVSVDDIAGGGGQGADFSAAAAVGSNTSVFRCEHCNRAPFASELFLMAHYEASHSEVLFAVEGTVAELFGSGAAAQQKMSAANQQQLFGWVTPIPAPWTGIPRKLVSIPPVAASTIINHDPNLATAENGYLAAAAAGISIDPSELPPAPEHLHEQVLRGVAAPPAVAAAVANAAAGRFRCEHCGRSSFSSQSAFSDHLRDKHNMPQAAALATAAAAAAGGGPATTTSASSASATNASSTASSSSSEQQQQQVKSGGGGGGAVGYECVHCRKTFSTFVGLEEHVKKKHIGMSPPSPSMPTAISASSLSQHDNNNDDALASSLLGDRVPIPAPPSMGNIVGSSRAGSGKSNSPSGAASSGGSSSSCNTGNDKTGLLGIVPPPPPPSSAAVVKVVPLPPAVAAAQQAAAAKPNSWWCNTCNRGFDSGKALLGHMQGKHAQRTQQLPCPRCKRTCPDPYSLLDHITKSHGDAGNVVDLAPFVAMCEGYRCESCGLRFLNQRELDTHELLTHAGQPASKHHHRHHHHRSSSSSASSSAAEEPPMAGAQRWRANF